MEWNKVTTLSKILALILFVALPFIGFYLGMRYGDIVKKVLTASEGTTTTVKDITSEVVSAPSITTPQSKAAKIASSELSYGAAVNLYATRRIQVVANCQLNPTSISLLNNTSVMFDNRTPESKMIALDGTKYTLTGYGFRIITLKSGILPHTVRIDCGSGVNNGQVILQ